jgi:hypothetical protein
MTSAKGARTQPQGLNLILYQSGFFVIVFSQIGPFWPHGGGFDPKKRPDICGKLGFHN